MKNIIRLILIALIAAAVWQGRSYFTQEPSEESVSANPSEQDLGEAELVVEVRVQNLKAELMMGNVDVTGRTQASRDVTLKSETDGQIASILIEKGQHVSKGDVLAKLHVRDRVARVREAEELLQQRNIQFNASKELTERGFNSRVRLAEARAQLESARAQLKQAWVELDNIKIKAPFDSIINEQFIEIGDFVSKGDDLLKLVDLNPMEVRGFLTEQQVQKVTLGQEAQVQLLGQGVSTGTISFIASAANEQTRTFPIEITIDNSDYGIRQGLTTKVSIAAGQVQAYKISPSILSLSDDGTVGIKVVNERNIVEFSPVDLLRDTPSHLWVGGLPEEIQAIIVGQDFVVPGQEVNPVVVEKGLLQ